MNTTILEKIKSDNILQEIIKNFTNEIYLVGGSVRDYFLGKNSFDRDIIVVDEDPCLFSKKVAEMFDATFISLDEINKIYRIVLKDKINYLDITSPIENSIEKDLKRRDISINSIAVNIRSGEIIDYTNGINDIKNKVIRCISEKNIEDDPLRILRIYRFHSLFGFDITDETLSAVKKYSKLVKKPAIERINYEILKLFSGEFAHITLEKMNEVGILDDIFPFIIDVKKIPPNTHHHLDLFHHCLETVKQIQKIYENSNEEVKEHLDLVDFGGFSRLSHLKMAGFMHDIGKFSTWTIEESGRHRFIKHDDVGSKMSIKLLKDMHFSNKQIEYISMMIKNHIYPSQVMSSENITEKVMMRYVRKMDKNSIDGIILAQADRLSAQGPAITKEIVEKNINSLNNLLDFYLEIRKTLKPLPKLLDGNDVMQILNIKPSKYLGEVLSSLQEAQINGDVITKEQAIDFVVNAFSK